MKPLLLIAILFTSISTTFAQQQEVEFTSFQLSDTIYMLRGRGGNVGISTGEDGLYIIDDLSIAPPSGGPLEATAFDFDSVTNELTITWKSRTNKTYSIEFSSDLGEWPDNVDTNIPATGGETSHVFQHPGLPSAFFRVLEE